MIYVPRSYGKEVTRFIIDTPRSNIWLDPGMGKTAIALQAFDFLYLAGSNKFPVIVIAPLRVARSVWSDECKKWENFSGLRVSQIIGTEEQRIAGLKKDAEIYTINYENLPWLVERLAKDWWFKSCVADESTNLKGFRLRHGAKRAGALSKAAKFTARWVNLTGTPAPQGLIDLWGQNWFVDGGKRLGKTFTAYKSRWFDDNKYSGSVTPKDFAEEQIMNLMRDVTFSLKADDAFDLDPIIENPIYVDLPMNAMLAYRELEQEMYAEFEDNPAIEAKTAADLSLKCLQMVAGAVYRPESTDWDIVHNAKLDALRGLLTELAGNPLLVAYHFKTDVKRILEKIPQARLIKTKQDEDDWNEGKILCGLVHPASAGHGLSLQDGGHHLAFFSNWWNLEHYMQVIERIGPVRQLQSGYERRVFVHYILARDTIDDVVMERRRGKQSTQDLIRRRASRAVL